MLKWRNPLLGVVRDLLPGPPELMSLSAKAAALPSSSLTFFIGGMAAAEGWGSLRFNVLGIVDDILEIDVCVGAVGIAAIVL